MKVYHTNRVIPQMVLQKCKFSDFDAGDERFLTNSFSKQGITRVSDEGFKPIHDYMTGILKNRHYNYR